MVTHGLLGNRRVPSNASHEAICFLSPDPLLPEMSQHVQLQSPLVDRGEVALCALVRLLRVAVDHTVLPEVVGVGGGSAADVADVALLLVGDVIYMVQTSEFSKTSKKIRHWLLLTRSGLPLHLRGLDLLTEARPEVGLLESLVSGQRNLVTTEGTPE